MAISEVTHKHHLVKDSSCVKVIPCTRYGKACLVPLVGKWLGMAGRMIMLGLPVAVLRTSVSLVTR